VRLYIHLGPKIPGISEMELQMWAAVLGDFSFFLLGEPLARCKFFLEMNLQFNNIIVDTLTSFAGFFPFDGGSPRKT